MKDEGVMPEWDGGAEGADGHGEVGQEPATVVGEEPHLEVEAHLAYRVIISA